jgi:hypothetical protein
LNAVVTTVAGMTKSGAGRGTQTWVPGSKKAVVILGAGKHAHRPRSKILTKVQQKQKF